MIIFLNYTYILWCNNETILSLIRVSRLNLGHGENSIESVVPRMYYDILSRCFKLVWEWGSIIAYIVVVVIIVVLLFVSHHMM